MPRRDEPQIGLAKAIRQLRREGQLSQEALGLMAGIHPTWISHIESGRVNPTWGNVRRIADGLRVPLPNLPPWPRISRPNMEPPPNPRAGRGAVETSLGWLCRTQTPSASLPDAFSSSAACFKPAAPNSPRPQKPSFRDVFCGLAIAVYARLIKLFDASRGCRYARAALEQSGFALGQGNIASTCALIG